MNDSEIRELIAEGVRALEPGLRQMVSSEVARGIEEAEESREGLVEMPVPRLWVSKEGDGGGDGFPYGAEWPFGLVQEPREEGSEAAVWKLVNVGLIINGVRLSGSDLVIHQRVDGETEEALNGQPLGGSQVWLMAESSVNGWEIRVMLTGESGPNPPPAEYGRRIYSDLWFEGAQLNVGRVENMGLNEVQLWD